MSENPTPAFMLDDLPATMPDLDRSALQAGTPVVVVEPSYRRRKPDPIPAVVTSRARVWIVVEETGRDHPRSWRFRLDDQTDGADNSYYCYRFRSPGQERYERAVTEADAYLREQGIRLDYGTAWTGRAVELARIIWAAETRDPSTGGA